MTFLDGGSDVDALRTDRYLDAFLATDSRATEPPAGPPLDRSLRDAAARLRRYLTPVHPSFRFEERLGARLAEAARSMRVAEAAGSEGALVPLRALPAADELVHQIHGSGGAARSRPLIIGGALTSAALSLAGAAFVAWRRARTPRRTVRHPRRVH